MAYLTIWNAGLKIGRKGVLHKVILAGGRAGGRVNYNGELAAVLPVLVHDRELVQFVPAPAPVGEVPVENIPEAATV